MKVNVIIEKLEERLESKKQVSAWTRGVYAYAFELVDNLEDDELAYEELEHILLNGAKDWITFSWGGCSLIYDEDIAKRLCTPSELKKRDHGHLKPNRREDWLDTQARALYQAFHIIAYIILRGDLV